MNYKKFTLTALFAAVAVVGSLISFPVLGSKCAPVQHVINVLCSIFLGPGYGLACAFVASLIRNMLGLGTVLAFPGSMCGAFLSGILYKYFHRYMAAYLGEIFGTAIIGGMLAYPLALFVLKNQAATLFMFVVPFLISTVAGTIISFVIVNAFRKTGLVSKLAETLK